MSAALMAVLIVAVSLALAGLVLWAIAAVSRHERNR